MVMVPEEERYVEGNMFVGHGNFDIAQVTFHVGCTIILYQPLCTAVVFLVTLLTGLLYQCSGQLVV